MYGIRRKENHWTEVLFDSQLNWYLILYLIVTGLDLEAIHTRYEAVLEVMKERKCSLAQAMKIYGVARNTLRDFIGICELKIVDQDKFNNVIALERESQGRPSVRGIEQRCRAAKEERKLLPFFPLDGFYADK